MTIIASQCRAARAMLNWSRDELAEAATVAKRTIVDFERGARNPQRSTLTLIEGSLNRVGIEFIDANGGGPGVRLKGGE